MTHISLKKKKTFFESFIKMQILDGYFLREDPIHLINLHNDKNYFLP